MFDVRSAFSPAFNVEGTGLTPAAVGQRAAGAPVGARPRPGATNAYPSRAEWLAAERRSSDPQELAGARAGMHALVWLALAALLAVTALLLRAVMLDASTWIPHVR